MEKNIAGYNINVNDEGYLEDLNQWNKDIASEIAKMEGINEMTDRHWEVIDYLQEQQKNNVALTIRRVGKSGVVSIKDFYALFPNGPLKISTKIAGIPKPVSCI